jgi:hypothetical protein
LAPQIEAQIATLSGTCYRDRLTELHTEIALLGSRKEECMRRLERCEATMRDAADTIASCIAHMDRVDGKLLGLSAALDHAVYASMVDLEQRARATVVEQLYYFAKAFQYRFLQRVEPEFYRLDAFVDQLTRFLECRNEKDGDMEQLTEGEFDLMYRMLEERLRERILPIADDIQHNRLMYKRTWLIHARELIDEATLRRINTPLPNQHGAQVYYEPVAFNLVRSGYASANAVKLRIVDLKLESLAVADVGAFKGGLSLSMRFIHSGVSVLFDGRERYVFRAQSPAERITWEFTSSIDSEGNIVITPVTVSTVEAELLEKLTPGDATVAELLAAYWPGGSSDITIQRVSSGNVAGGEITDFVIRVELEELHTDRTQVELKELHTATAGA